MTTYPKRAFLQARSSQGLILASVLMCAAYFGVIAFVFPPGNELLFALLLAGEAFHAWQALTYLYTVFTFTGPPPRTPGFAAAVDVFITVAGEPEELVSQTVRAAQAMRYPNFQVFILNDGYVAGKDNWRAIEHVAEELGVTCITRQEPGGAKAGNINHALSLTRAPYVAVFDADHVPHPDFLEKVMPYFGDKRLGFVQTPQFYKNAALNAVTRGAWEQQELFYGPICQGKNAVDAATLCGTNMVLSRQALADVGGMCADSIAEDFATGLFIHEHGYRSYYHPEVLAEGLAPEDFLSYTKQQYRWPRGALDVLFKYHLVTRPGLTWAQKIQYLASVSYFLSGWVVVFNMLLPLIFFYAGLIPLQISTMLLALVFVPYIFCTLAALSVSSNNRFTLRALSFAMSSYAIQIQALWAALLQKRTAFAITPKFGVEGNYIRLIIPQLVYIGLVCVGLPVAVIREGLSASVLNNLAWAIFSICVSLPYVQAAVPALGWQEVRARVLQGLSWLAPAGFEELH